MEKINIWSEIFRVRSYQMDMNAHATITSIAGYLQEAAGNHAHAMGFGYKQMQQTGMIWLLTRMKISVTRYPEWGEQIELNTWVVDAEKFFSRRDFEIKDKSGNVIVSAISGWMLVNAKEKRPQHVDGLSRNIDYLKDKKALNEEIKKIEPVQKVDQISHYKVKYSDIDVVGHVNNIRYYSIILDSLAFGFLKIHKIKSFEINYLAEALPEEELDVVSEKLIENVHYLYEIRKPLHNKVLCRAEITWQELN